MTPRTLSALALTIGAFLSGPSQANSGPAKSFFEGKAITVIVGSDVGGGYDANGRLMARHLGDFIPGHPTIVVQNMPGAGSLVAANYLYNIAPGDGTVVGLIQRGDLIAKLTGQKVAFDPDKINWIGNLAAEPGLVVAWHTAPVKSAADLFKMPFVVGGAGVIGENEIIPRLLNRLIGTKFKVILGYPGNASVLLAMQRGELQGAADWAWPDIKQHPEFLREKLINLLLVSNDHKQPDIPGVPLVVDFAKTPIDRQALEIYFSLKDVSRPVMAPPGVPSERIQILRRAFMEMAQSEAFLADAKKSHLDVSPSPAESIEKIVRSIATAPPEVTRRLREGIAPPDSKGDE